MMDTSAGLRFLLRSSRVAGGAAVEPGADQSAPNATRLVGSTAAGFKGLLHHEPTLRRILRSIFSL